MFTKLLCIGCFGTRQGEEESGTDAYWQAASQRWHCTFVSALCDIWGLEVPVSKLIGKSGGEAHSATKGKSAQPWEHRPLHFTGGVWLPSPGGTAFLYDCRNQTPFCN